MMTVHEVSRLTGVSIRALQYYDKIGLLSPAEYTDSGYRLYDDASLEKLQQIMLFRELEFPLKEIRKILGGPGFDRNKALEQQTALLKLKKEHLENLIQLAEKSLTSEVKTLDFKAFDTTTIDEYAAQAKASWGDTPEYKEFEERDKNRTAEDHKDLAGRMMDIFAEFGKIKNRPPESEEAASLVKKLQDFITANYYSCSDDVLASLGQLYGAGGDFTVNINKAAGDGAAEFASKAIEAYLR